jgi:hypothetical protein
MKLGVMQPYFFPYLGYYSLIKNTDMWVVFDTVQYINKGWINRNRILSPAEDGFSYINIPVVNGSRDMLIKDAMIDQSKNWKEKIMGQIAYYKKRAPYYQNVKSLIEDVLCFETSKISELNIYALQRTCEYLNVDFNYKVFSDDTMGIKYVSAPDEWALMISLKLGADTYINPPGGKTFFDKQKYQNEGINLQFLSINQKPYKTYGLGFIPGLSVIDVMMFNSAEEINKMLDDYEI